MAVVKGAFHCDQASGNVGALCASSWRGRAVMRDAWTGTVPNTSAQQTIQGWLSTFAQSWGQTLTQEQRDAWENLARSVKVVDRWGDYRHPTGYNLFLKRNMHRRRAYGTALLIPSEGGELFHANRFEAVWYSAYSYVRHRFVILDSANNWDFVEYWRAGPYDSPARRPIEGEWKFLVHKKPPNPNNDSTPTASKYYWYRGRAGWASGIVGNWWETKAYTG